MRLLVVEDDAHVGSFITQGLQDEGYEVVWTTTGEEAVRRVHDGFFDLVLLYQTLPDRSGIEVARNIRARGVQVPILMVTAHDALAERQAAIAAGANDVVGKPFRFADLLVRIHSMLPE